MFKRCYSFLQSSGFRWKSLLVLLSKKGSWSSLFLLLFETCEQKSFFSENFAVNLDRVRAVARAFEKNVATIVVDSMSCGSDSHCVT